MLFLGGPIGGQVRDGVYGDLHAPFIVPISQVLGSGSAMRDENGLSLMAPAIRSERYNYRGDSSRTGEHILEWDYPFRMKELQAKVHSLQEVQAEVHSLHEVIEDLTDQLRQLESDNETLVLKLRAIGMLVA